MVIVTWFIFISPDLIHFRTNLFPTPFPPCLSLFVSGMVQGLGVLCLFFSWPEWESWPEAVNGLP